MKQSNYSLRTFFTFIFAIVALVPLLLAIAATVFYIKPIEDRQRLNHLNTAGLLVSSRIKSMLDQGAHELQALSKSIEQNLEITELTDNLITNFSRNNANFQTIYIANKEGVIVNIGLESAISHLKTNFIGLDISQRKFYLEGANAKTGGWSGSFLSVVGGRLAIAYSTPVGEKLIIGELSLNLLPDVLNDINDQTKIVVMILDQANQLVAHPDHDLSNQQINLSNINLVKNSENKTGLRQFTVGEQQLIGIYLPIPDTSWSILVARPVEIEIQRNRSFVMVIVVTILGSIILAFGLAIYMGGFLTNNVLQYAYAIKNLATGLKSNNFSGAKSRIRELDSLSSDIKQTSQIIIDREIDLEIINKELETRVQKRTEDLHEANTELKGTLTTLEQAQSELIQSEKMASLGSLVAGIAHELNTPIGIAVTAITTQMDYQNKLLQHYQQNKLTKSYLEEYMEDVSESCNIILNNLNRSANLIKSFKQVAVDQTSDLQRKFELSQTIQDIVLALHPITKKTNHKINLDIQDHILMNSYPGALGQVITNLINNALIHGLSNSPAGTISIKGWLDEDNRHAIIVLSDDGIGIRQNIQHRIFEPFYTTNRSEGGSGLGLNIVHNLVNSVLLGHIKVKSISESGTEFTISLPLDLTTESESSIIRES